MTTARTPADQWRRRLRRHFVVASVACAIEAVCTIVLFASGSVLLGAAAGIAAILLARSARRRWDRHRAACESMRLAANPPAGATLHARVASR